MLKLDLAEGLLLIPVEQRTEVPSTYSSYPEFRTEFDNILSSNYLEMDIL